jgi:N-acetylmuramoyl-L-alanine amidase
MSSDKKKEIEYLKKLIIYGDKLDNIDTLKYKRELNRLDKNIIVTNNKVQTVSKLKPVYSIKTINETENTIVITFNKNINSSYLKFYEKKVNDLFRDYFDIKGDYKYARIKNIKLKNINNTKLYQKEPGLLRIYLEDQVNPRSLYMVNKNQIIIKVFENKIKDKVKFVTKKAPSNKDLEYTIKSIEQKENTIEVEFTHKVNKSHIDFFEENKGDYYIDGFDIKGNFKNAKTKKITLGNIERTKVSQYKKDILRITLKNKKNPKTIYILAKKKIIIKLLEDEPKKLVQLFTNASKKAPFIKDPKYTIKSVNQIENAIVIDFTHKIDKSHIDFFEEKKNGYHIDGFDIKGNFKGAKAKKINISSIDRTKIFQHKKDTLRITLKNRQNPKTIYILGKNKIIIKVLDQNRKKPIETKDLISPYEKTIVIDAGHGGKDSGAIYGKHRYEKNIVLNISKYLKKELDSRGFNVHLTRSRDKYIKLPNRTKYANKRNADMFISIHANAARKSRAKVAHGVETYFLSPARSAKAKRVAALENKGDIKNMGWSSQNSLLTILNQSKITASNKMAIDIQRNMLYYLRQRYGKKAIKDGGVREGPFWVLVGAQMPSVLVEIGYISHPTEGRRINTQTYQKLVARGIANGIERYFIKN